MKHIITLLKVAALVAAIAAGTAVVVSVSRQGSASVPAKVEAPKAAQAEQGAPFWCLQFGDMKEGWETNLCYMSQDTCEKKQVFGRDQGLVVGVCTTATTAWCYMQDSGTAVDTNCAANLVACSRAKQADKYKTTECQQHTVRSLVQAFIKMNNQ